jgi:hypothetical protein
VALSEVKVRASQQLDTVRVVTDDGLSKGMLGCVRLSRGNGKSVMGRDLLHLGDWGGCKGLGVIQSAWQRARRPATSSRQEKSLSARGVGFFQAILLR